MEKSLDKTIWKACGNFAMTDVLIFNHEYLRVKNDTIYNRKNNLAVGTIDTLNHHFGERRLYIKDFKGNVARYCEQ